MSTGDLDNVRQMAPAWNGHKVMVFHGQHDTHISTGEFYDTRTLASLFSLDPTDTPKMDGLAFIPSTYDGHDGRNHAVQRAEGRFVALCGDVDKGNQSLERVEQQVRGFVGDAAWLIYSSAHSRADDQRWRIIIPLAEPLPFEEWHDAQHAFFNFMEYAGIDMDRALDRAAQPVYLPNVPAVHGKTGIKLRGDDGEPLYYSRATSGTSAPGLRHDAGQLASGMEAIARKRIEDDKERERIRAEAEKRRANRPRTDDVPVMEDFNRNTPIANLLELYGYKQSPRHSEDWRSPHQTGESFATRVMGEKWVSLSQSDASSGLGEKCAAGCFGDAYDLFVHYEHGGDHKAAFRTLYAERRASTTTVSAPPPLPPDDPGPMPLEEDLQYEPDPVGDFVPEPQVSDDSTFELLTLSELENMPPPVWLVDKVIGENGLAIVYGDPGSGKSFITIDMALRLAMGWDWHGSKAKRVGVLYIAGEGVRGLGKRVKGWRRHHKVAAGADAPFVLMPVAAQLLEPADRAKLLRTIDAAIAKIGFDIGLIVIDTVSRSIAGQDENGQETMSALVKACDDVRAYCGCTIIGVHHSGKDKDRGMRGSTVLLGACDTTIKVTKSESIVTVKCEKQKDDEEGPPIYFEMERLAWHSPTEDEPDRHDSTLVPLKMERSPDATTGITRDKIAAAFGMLADAWGAGKPLSSKPQTRKDGRYAPSIFASQIGGDAQGWDSLIESWLASGCLSYEEYDTRSKKMGLRVLDAIV